jgi:transcription-repair coupling factor (superfamily II helicase)
MLVEHGLERLTPVETWAEAAALNEGLVAVCVVGLERGFESDSVSVITEPDILGERLSRPVRPRV